MNHLTKAYRKVNDDFHERLRLIMPCKRRAEKLLPSIPADLEVQQVTVHDSLSDQLFERNVEIIPASPSDVTIGVQITVNWATHQGNVLFKVNGEDDVHFSEQLTPNGVIASAHYVHHSEHDVSIEATAVCGMDLAIYPPADALIGLSVAKGPATVTGQFKRNDPYPEVYERIHSDIVHPVSPLSLAFRPQVVGAVLGFGGTNLIPVPIPGEPDDMKRYLSVACAIALDLLHCNWACTGVMAGLNVILLDA